MEPITFPAFMSEENMRRMDRPALVELFRRMWQDFLPPQMAELPDPAGVPVAGERMEIPVRGGTVRVILYRAQRRHAPVHFDMHGGGFVGGNCEDIDFWCDMIRRELDVNVVNINYRKAPDHPWPTAANDAFDAVRWFFDRAADFDLDTERMSIGGHSAGANLSAVTCLRTVTEAAPYRFRAMILDYPPLDLKTCAFDKFSHPLGIPPQVAMLFDACYIAPGQGGDPLVSPLYASDELLRQQPPACIISAEFDSLRDEAERYARRLAENGVAVWSRRFLGSAHGFTMTLDGHDPMLPEDPNARPACEMMLDAIRYALR